MGLSSEVYMNNGSVIFDNYTYQIILSISTHIGHDTL